MNSEEIKITKLFIRFLKKNNLIKLCELKTKSFLSLIPSYLRLFDQLYKGEVNSLNVYGGDAKITITDYLPTINRTLTIKYDNLLFNVWDIKMCDDIYEHWEIRTKEEYYIILLYEYFLIYLHYRGVIKKLTFDLLYLKNNLLESIKKWKI